VVEDQGALGERRLAPGVLGLVAGVERELHVLGVDLATSQNCLPWPADVVHVLALHRSDPLAPDEVVVAGLSVTTLPGFPGAS